MVMLVLPGRANCGNKASSFGAVRKMQVDQLSN
jgi:hypothetical protein